MAFHDYKNTKEQENLKEQNNTNELNGTGYHSSSTLLQPHDYYSPPSYVNISSSDLLGLHQMIKNYLFDNPSAINDKVIYCLYALICYNVCLIIWCQYQWYGGRSCTSPCDISSKERWKQNQSYLPLQTFDNDGDWQEKNTITANKGVLGCKVMIDMGYLYRCIDRYRPRSRSRN